MQPLTPTIELSLPPKPLLQPAVLLKIHLIAFLVVAFGQVGVDFTEGVGVGFCGVLEALVEVFQGIVDIAHEEVGGAKVFIGQGVAVHGHCCIGSEERQLDEDVCFYHLKLLICRTHSENTLI